MMNFSFLRPQNDMNDKTVTEIPWNAPGEQDPRIMPISGDKPDYLALTSNQYPAIADSLSKMSSRTSVGKNDNMLEFYPPGEKDSFDPSKPAIDIYTDKVRPQDIAGDVVSHYLARGQDKTLTDYYDKFQGSMTPQQLSTLEDQYKWSVQHEGETRPLEKWKEKAGIPAYFRGYAFGQWPNSEHMYTPEQVHMFDQMNSYLKGQ